MMMKKKKQANENKSQKTSLFPRPLPLVLECEILSFLRFGNWYNINATSHSARRVLHQYLKDLKNFTLIGRTTERIRYFDDSYAEQSDECFMHLPVEGRHALRLIERHCRSLRRLDISSGYFLGLRGEDTERPSENELIGWCTRVVTKNQSTLEHFLPSCRTYVRIPEPLKLVEALTGCSRLKIVDFDMLLHGAELVGEDFDAPFGRLLQECKQLETVRLPADHMSGAFRDSVVSRTCATQANVRHLDELSIHDLSNVPSMTSAWASTLESLLIDHLSTNVKASRSQWEQLRLWLPKFVHLTKVRVGHAWEELIGEPTLWSTRCYMPQLTDVAFFQRVFSNKAPLDVTSQRARRFFDTPNLKTLVVYHSPVTMLQWMVDSPLLESVKASSHGYANFAVAWSANDDDASLTPRHPAIAHLWDVALEEQKLWHNMTSLLLFRPENCGTSCSHRWSAVYNIGIRFPPHRLLNLSHMHNLQHVALCFSSGVWNPHSLYEFFKQHPQLRSVKLATSSDADLVHEDAKGTPTPTTVLRMEHLQSLELVGMHMQGVEHLLEFPVLEEVSLVRGAVCTDAQLAAFKSTKLKTLRMHLYKPCCFSTTTPGEQTGRWQQLQTLFVQDCSWFTEWHLRQLLLLCNPAHLQCIHLVNCSTTLRARDVVHLIIAGKFNKLRHLEIKRVADDVFDDKSEDVFHDFNHDGEQKNRQHPDAVFQAEDLVKLRQLCPSLRLMTNNNVLTQTLFKQNKTWITSDDEMSHESVQDSAT